VSRRSQSSPRVAATAPAASLRVDKWLWSARFFKTRGLAQEAVDGGHVQLNGERVKAARAVRAGDRLRIVRERERIEIEVLGIPARRGPAAEAQQLYVESDESRAARERQREFNRLSMPIPESRPDKRARRELMRLRGREPAASHGDDDPGHDREPADET
jgi:ribosome-associated heat shock protein Hsp15